MGQRLVISLNRENEEILNVYYHWSGFTIDSLTELGAIVKDLNKGFVMDDFIQKLSETDARLSEGDLLEYSYLAHLLPTDDKPLSRNSGLISISDKERSTAMDWAEMIIEVEEGSTQVFLGQLYRDIEHGELKEEEIEEASLCEITEMFPLFPFICFDQIAPLVKWLSSNSEEGYFKLHGRTQCQI